MKLVPFDCYKDNNSNCIYFSIEHNIEIFNVYFNYGYESDSNAGYAHLLEHMIIKANQKEWSSFWKNGVQFNAVTKEYTTIFTFLNLRNSNFLFHSKKNIEETFKDLHTKGIDQELLESEKRTILEELSILEKQFSENAAAAMLGNRNEITSFTISKMIEIYMSQYVALNSIYIGNLADKKDSYIPIHKKVFPISHEGIVTKKDKSEFALTDCFESNIILYFLHICYVSQLHRGWDMKIYKDAAGIRLKFIGQLVLKHKRNILNRYCLSCSNLKMYMDEVSYIVMNNLSEVNIEDMFLENWEGVFNE